MANQTYRTVLTGNAAGQFVQNILHFRMDDDSFANRLFAAKGLVDGFMAAALDAAFLEMLPDTYLLMSIKARRITDGGGPEWIDVSMSGSPGTEGSNMEISGSGPVLIWNTDGGPKRVGKTFLAGVSPSFVDGGELTAAFITKLKTQANLLRTPFPAVGGSTPTCTMCIPRANDPSTRSLIVGVQVSKIIGKQRRRQLPV